ncbi:MAG: hypothetical protein DRH57_01375 [Candidatus Cloacimonadota bacterium]|nr:MAG: hypothetical protein DRH57_01375 [Candidatus Cloacimonadota bacterium]
MAKFSKGLFILILVILFLCSTIVIARMADETNNSKKLDIFNYHYVGNIWLRVSNYGFFGAGDDITPKWPSLEYPGGSAIDYLYQGALWFGAKKYRRGDDGRIVYEVDPVSGDSIAIIDTLVSIGFDGYHDVMEFLPAYNPLEENPLGGQYTAYNLKDKILESSIRTQKTGNDDDGDGMIDEDPPGFALPFRVTEEMPGVFSIFGGQFMHELDPDQTVAIITDERNSLIWFPLGFVDLSYIDPDSIYCFSEEEDDDDDGLSDEDGFPTSEQDFLSYYYDYSPFGTAGNRDWGSWRNSNNHVPLNIRVRQISFQWSYEYIKNLCYIEFDITNMNPNDTLYDCAMGIYMDSDIGPQAWGGRTISTDDISSYVKGSSYEFAYSYDSDGDGGLTTGMIGARVCTPDPDQLDFECWSYSLDVDPPDDFDPLSDPSGGKLTANEKYWLLTGRNPGPDRFVSLRQEPDNQIGDPCDTRYLFAFYGDMKGASAPTDSSWNLAPGKTMKIVIALFPGENLTELKSTALWAKSIYGEAQTLTTVVLPDTFDHYNAPGPPDIPKMTLEQSHNGDSIFVYWDNGSEFTYDPMTVDEGLVGYQNLIPYWPSYDPDIQPGDSDYNENAIVPRDIADRLRHDFQGYTVWHASGSGEQDAYEMVARWDKIDTKQDLEDYDCCMYGSIPEDEWMDFGGQLGNDTGLPDSHRVKEKDIVYISDNDTIYWTDYYQLDDLYEIDSIAVGDTIYGMPLYAADVDSSVSTIGLSLDQEQLLFKNPNVPDDVYLALCDDKLIPLPGHLGQNHPGFDDFAEMRKYRLARRLYKYTIKYPEKGVENYISVTAFDRGMPSKPLMALESGRDANRITVFPGPTATSNMDNIYVVPNPYLGQSKFDGRKEGDEKGDRSKRIWFVNLPLNCKVKIFTLAGDLVDEFEHHGEHYAEVLNPSKAAPTGITSGGIHEWNMLSKYDQIIASGVYLYSVKNIDTGDVKVDKFVIIK